MAGRTDARLKALGLELPPPARSVGRYAPYVRTGQLIWCVQGPLEGDSLAYQGKVGRDYDLEQARACARLVCLNLLTQVNAACGGDLDRVRRCVRLGGFINSAPGFNRQTEVMNGASDLLLEIFGEERGRHARFAVGASELPYDLAVEIEGVFEVE